MDIDNFINIVKTRFSGVYDENIWLDECNKDSIILSEDNIIDTSKIIVATIKINVSNNWEFCIDAIYDDNENDKIFTRSGNGVEAFYKELSRSFPVGEKWIIQNDMLRILQEYIPDVPR